MSNRTACVYDAEHRVQRWTEQDGPVRVYGSEWYPEQPIRFCRISDVQSYVDRVLTFIGEQPTVKVRARRGAAAAHYQSGEIAIPRLEIGGKWAMTSGVVLHELAHHLSRAEGGHGPSFCRKYIDLLSRTGFEITSRLTEIAMREIGVEIA